MRERGLSLVELLVALLLMGLTLAAAAGVFRSALLGACRLRATLLVQGELQRVLALLADDLEEWTLRVPGTGPPGPGPAIELPGAVRDGTGRVTAGGLVLRKHRILEGGFRGAPVPEGADLGAWVASDRPILLHPGDLLATGKGPALALTQPALVEPGAPADVPLAAPAALEPGAPLEVIRPVEVTWGLVSGHLVRRETGGGRSRRDPSARITGFRITLPEAALEGRPAWVEVQLEGTCGGVRRRATLAVAPRNPAP